MSVFVLSCCYLPAAVGGNIQPKRDLTRFVRWPKYVRLQRQKRVLYQRLKVPPTIAQFTQTLDRQNGERQLDDMDVVSNGLDADCSVFMYTHNSHTHTHTATQLFRLLHKYRPETKAEKKERLRSLAQKKTEGGDATSKKKPLTVKYGINHVTNLIEQKKATLVAIAHDVDPIEVCYLM